MMDFEKKAEELCSSDGCTGAPKCGFCRSVAQGLREAYADGWKKAWDKVEDIASEFGHDPKQAIGIMGEWAHGQENIER